MILGSMVFLYGDNLTLMLTLILTLCNSLGILLLVIWVWDHHETFKQINDDMPKKEPYWESLKRKDTHAH